jgi:16S rRNA processing protein RimM
MVRPGPAEPRPGFTAVGRVIRPHGIRGELRVHAFNPAAQNIQHGRTVHLSGEPRQVVRARWDNDGWILQLSGMTTRGQVEELRGELLEVPDAGVVREDSESYFVHELVGLRVVTEEGVDLGAISDVLHTGANDVYVVRGAGGEVLIPAIADVVRDVDLGAGMMRITPLPGLLDESK